MLRVGTKNRVCRVRGNKQLLYAWSFKLWSQIKLTPNNFSDLQITNEFENLPSTGRFFNIFSLRGHISYGQRSASVYNNIPLVMMYTLRLTFAIMPPKKQIDKKQERLRLTLTVMQVKTSLAQDCKNFNSTCLLHVIQLLKRNICLYLYLWSLNVN